MRVKAFLFALCSILLLGACGTPKTGGTVYNIMPEMIDVLEVGATASR